MASIRRGYSDDFVIKNNKVGIGASNPQENLDVVGGALQGQDLKVTGVSTQTGFSGFLRADHQIAENTEFNNINVSSLSGEIIVGTGQTVTVSKVEDEYANANNGTVWSTYLSNSAGGFQDAYPASNAFNGKISATETSRSVNSQITSTWTPPKEITYSSSVEVWTYYAGSVSLNGGTAITVNNDQSWRKISGGSGTLTSITFSSNSGNSVYIAGIAIDGEILVDGFSTLVDKGARAGGSQIDTLKVYNTFTPPSGDTNQRPYAPKPGEFYYNYDFKTIEFFDGNGWRQVDNTTRSGRGVVGGGDSPGKTNSMEYITISTLGNAVDFGDQISARNVRGSCSSSTRGLWGGGASPNYGDDIDYITIASAGDAIDFGNLTQARGTYAGGMSSSTRGLWAAGATPTKVNTIDFVEIATLGNAVDFGDTASLTNTAATASPIRGYICGGNDPSVATRDIRQITIASKGDSVDIAELSAISNSSSAASNSVRTVLFGGQSPAQDIRSMETFNLVTAGNAVVFGDLSGIRMLSASVASSTRGVCMSGRNPSNVNNIEYVTFSSLGDAIDFGDMSLARHKFQGCSDSHGGLGGF